MLPGEKGEDQEQEQEQDQEQEQEQEQEREQEQEQEQDGDGGMGMGMGMAECGGILAECGKALEKRRKRDACALEKMARGMLCYVVVIIIY